MKLAALLFAGITVVALGITPFGQALAAEAQAEAGFKPIPQEYQQPVQAAEARGLEMYRYDQSAWHATDRFQADLGNRPTDRFRGYIVLPSEGDRLATVFYGVIDGRQVEMARYETLDGRVVGGQVFAEGEQPALSDLALQMIAARATALKEAEARKYGICGQSINTLILPPDSAGVISAYVLTPPVNSGSYPIGGHYRIDIGPDGKVVSARRFLNSCLEGVYETEAGEQSVAVVASHLLDPQPTEIHAFASRYLPVQLMLATTGNQLMWALNRGAVRLYGSLDELRAGASGKGD